MSKALEIGRAAIQLAGDLDAEPLYHMSLGSKELFHSNLIAWFAKKYPAAACAVLGPWAGDDAASTSHRVGREDDQLDLVVELPGHRPLVIENKVFSMPDETQLDRYARGPAAKMERRPSLVLLSLADPGWRAGQYGGPHGIWRYLGYDSLRTGLLAVVEDVRRKDPYDGDTLKHYCELVRLLCELRNLAAVRDDDDPIALPAETADGLASARAADHARKLRMHQVEARLRARLSAEADNVRVKCAFTNGAPLVEAFVPLVAMDTIGWQYQDGQFRLALLLQSHEGRGDDAKRRREVHARTYEAWFDFTEFHSVLGTTDATTVPGRMRTAPDGFCHFDPAFVYRYRKPPAMTIRQLLDVGSHYVRVARGVAASLAAGR